MSKGDNRRPSRVRQEEFARNWERAFGSRGRMPSPRLKEAVERATKDFRARPEPTEAPSHPDVLGS